MEASTSSPSAGNPADPAVLEATLEENPSRPEAVLERITDAFYALDGDWRITQINERALRFAAVLARTELARDQVLGWSLWELLPETVGSALEEHYRRAMREQRTVSFEYRYPGAEPWFDVQAYPSLGGLSVYFREIGDRKRAETERACRTRQQAMGAELGLKAGAGGRRFGAVLPLSDKSNGASGGATRCRLNEGRGGARQNASGHFLP